MRISHTRQDIQHAALEKLEACLGYEFANDLLLQQAMVHRSALGAFKSKDTVLDNDRLEFLGDAVLDLIASDMLYNHDNCTSAGNLSKLRAATVDEAALVCIARKLELERVIVVGPGERADRTSILADAVEALVGAIYLDSDFATTYQVIQPLLQPRTSDSLSAIKDYDTKTALQEFIQQTMPTPPTYKTLAMSGPDHARSFKVGVFLEDELLASATGPSKKLAEKKAAKLALERLAKPKPVESSL